MEKTLFLRGSFRAYLALAKPGIVLGNAMTCTAGFALASQGQIDPGRLLATLSGLSLIIASGCIANNYLDRERDAKMARTKNRPLVQGSISLKSAKTFSILLALLGTLFLGLWTHFLAVEIALFGLFAYLVLYTFAKTRSIHGTLVGSLAGAAPPVVGYLAVNPSLDLGALLLFLLLVLWQMPHFYAISLYRLKEYAAASLPVLPVKRGIRATQLQILFYIAAFLPVSSLFPFFGYVGYGYLFASVPLSFIWLWLSRKGFSCENTSLWARKMFLFSLVVITGLSVAFVCGSIL